LIGINRDGISIRDERNTSCIAQEAKSGEAVHTVVLAITIGKTNTREDTDTAGAAQESGTTDFCSILERARPNTVSKATGSVRTAD